MLSRRGGGRGLLRGGGEVVGDQVPGVLGHSGLFRVGLVGESGGFAKRTGCQPLRWPCPILTGGEGCPRRGVVMSVLPPVHQRQRVAGDHDRGPCLGDGRCWVGHVLGRFTARMTGTSDS